MTTHLSHVGRRQLEITSDSRRLQVSQSHTCIVRRTFRKALRFSRVAAARTQPGLSRPGPRLSGVRRAATAEMLELNSIVAYATSGLPPDPALKRLAKFKAPLSGEYLEGKSDSQWSRP